MTLKLRSLTFLAFAACIIGASAAQAQVEFNANMLTLRLQLTGQVLAENTDYGGGKDGLDDRTDLRFARFRMTFTGMYDDTYGFHINTQSATGTTKAGITGYTVASQQTDGNDGDIRLHDAYFIANYNDFVNLKVGLTKIPLTRGNLDGCFDPMGIDRSLFAFTGYGSVPMKASRDIGVNLWGKVNGGRAVYQVAAFQGREGFARGTHPFSGATVTSTPTPADSLLYVGRVHYSFLDIESESSGYEGSYLGDLKVFTIGAAVGYEADAVFKNVTSAGVIQNDETVDYKAYTVDMMFEYPTTSGTYTLTTAYLKNDFDNVHLTNLNPGDRITTYGGLNGDKEGWYARAGYLLPMTVGKQGRIQPYAYYENFDLAALAGVNEQTVTQKAVGVNYYIRGQNVRFTAEYQRNEFAKPQGFQGGRVNASNQPIDLHKKNTAIRTMFQVAF
jgi:hypothetical protein